MIKARGMQNGMSNRAVLLGEGEIGGGFSVSYVVLFVNIWYNVKCGFTNIEN